MGTCRPKRPWPAGWAQPARLRSRGRLRTKVQEEVVVTHLTNEEFAAKVLEVMGEPGPFAPAAYYDPDGDCIEFFASPDNFYAERVDDLLTVYYSERTGEVVGSLLKGIKRLCGHLLKRLPGLEIEVKNGPIKLSHIFTSI